MTEPRRSGFRADSLLTGMCVMLVLTVVQRGVGFVRGVWFCRLLDDVALGQWAMAFGFITLVTPVMLFGMPGSLPRFVEHYRLRGQLGRLVQRVLLATTVCGGGFLLLLLLRPGWFGWLVFLEPQSVELIYSVGAGAVTMIAFNFVNDLVASLRLVRVVSIMQFTQSIAFTLFAIGWLYSGGGLTGLVATFAAANVVAMIPGLLALATGWERGGEESSTFDAAAMWRRLLPYAAAIWAMNLLTNTFELSDRYMLLHLSSGGEVAGQAAVGQYHSGRVFPALLLSLATMLGGVLMPYLTADWEAGHRERVRARMRQSMFAVAIVFTVGAGCVQILSPLIFSTLLEGRYSDGLAVMPIAFVFSIWAALITIGQNYLWVLERGKWIAAAMGIGLVVNLILNAGLVPTWGLSGAVLATLLSHAVVMGGMWWSMHRGGYPLDSGTVQVTLLPATLLAGPWVALLAAFATLAVSREVREGLAEGSQRWNARRGGVLAAAK